MRGLRELISGLVRAKRRVLSTEMLAESKPVGLPASNIMFGVSQRSSHIHHVQPGFEIYAHRGLAQDTTENTHQAFQAALDAGADWLETDINTTADGHVVVFHDATLNRLCGIPGRVSTTTWDTLKDLPLTDGGSIPRLEDTLAAFPQARFNIDVKDRGSAHHLAALLARTGAAHRVRIASFSEGRKRQATRSAQAQGISLRQSASQPIFILFYLASRFHPALWGLIRPLINRWVSPFDAMQVPYRHHILGKKITIVDRKLVQAAHRYGKLVHVWTIDCEQEMAHLVNLGVDGIVTNRTDLLANLLGRSA